MSTTKRAPKATRSLRIADTLHDEAVEYAAEDGMNFSELVNDLLRDYVAKKRRTAARAV